MRTGDYIFPHFRQMGKGERCTADSEQWNNGKNRKFITKEWLAKVIGIWCRDICIFGSFSDITMIFNVRCLLTN